MPTSRGRGRNGGAAIDSNGEGPISIESLINELHKNTDGLVKDGATRGDVKILSRTIKELRYAFKVFASYRDRRKLSVFGSARSKPEDETFAQAVQLGRAMAQAGWMVITGASTGIMEAGHVGAGRENSMGVNILLPFEQEANHVIRGDSKLVHLKYFFTRKLIFVKESDAVTLLPGGFGTMDEAFEVLTLVQTGKRDMMPLVFLDEPGGDYWRSWDRYVHKFLLARGYVSAPDLSLYKVTENVADAVAEIQGFYRVFHSMRYVYDSLVLRLQQALPTELVERINDEFQDILVRGKFVQTTALPEESGDGHLQDLPRLVFHFDRKGLGRLRQLINVINQGTG
ncbi:MAG: TIGR00730 family Rossman fold protein [Planctomycetes bacterium]|nr:TIGR00730 family Rossman fold protein [Planctomycetota bacterium]